MITEIEGRNRRPWALGTRQVILNAATEEIALQGFKYARIGDIADRANLTPGSIYTWFENKEVLFRVALEEALNAQLAANVESLSKIEDFQQTPWLLKIATLLPRNNDNSGPTPAQVMLIEAFYVSWRTKDKEALYLPRLEEHFAAYQKIVTEAVASGEIETNFDPQLIAMLLLAIPTGLSLLQFSGLPRIPDNAWIPVYQELAKMLSPKN
ncbi:MAG: TetR/AcrR family transcriptional regulator [Ilumatobacteraceae bacterium]|nr:TetR/AcrR family transcriptional regulator [Ilumatobacteraceae bacterium]